MEAHEPEEPTDLQSRRCDVTFLSELEGTIEIFYSKGLMSQLKELNDLLKQVVAKFIDTQTSVP